MRIGVLGISFKSSELLLRELVAKACSRLFSSDCEEELSYVLLSTCNRTEIYFTSEDLAETHSALLASLRQDIDLPFEHTLYSYFGSDCFLHLARVTAGVDSLIFGESEIQRQVKTAYEHSMLARSLPAPLHFLFQKCLKIGKSIRTHYPSAPSQTSIEGMIFQLSRQFCSDLQKCSVLFIGNSEINRKIIHFFEKRGIADKTLCTRSPVSAEEVAAQYRLQLCDWSGLVSWDRYDLIISGTNHGEYLIKPFKQQRAVETQIIFDLSLPRTVDPSIARHPQISLFNIDEIGGLIKRKKEDHSHIDNSVQMAVEKQLAIYQQKVFACTI